MALTYRKKAHEPHARGFAVFDGDRYLGDVTPVGPKGEKTHPRGEYPVWSVHRAGESVRLEFVFLSRTDAASALVT